MYTSVSGMSTDYCNIELYQCSGSRSSPSGITHLSVPLFPQQLIQSDIAILHKGIIAFFATKLLKQCKQCEV